MPEKSKILVRGAAVLAAVGGLAAFLANIETITSAPKEILANLGFGETSAVATGISLANLGTEDLAKLALGQYAASHDVEFQKYQKVEETYCIEGMSIGRCPDAKENIQKPRLVLFNDLENSLYGQWGPAIPVFDVVSVRPDERDILITEQAVEFELLDSDRTPYMEIRGLESKEGFVTLVSHSFEKIEKVKLNFQLGDVISTADIDIWYDQHKDKVFTGSYGNSLEIKNGNLFVETDRRSYRSEDLLQNIDVKKFILKQFPDSKFVKMSEFFPEATETTEEDSWIVLTGVTPSWSSSSDQTSEEHDFSKWGPKDLSVVMYGEMEVQSSDGQKYSSNFVAPVVVSSAKGYGGGGVNVDSNVVYSIDGETEKGTVSKPIKSVLSDASPTIRSQSALKFEKSGLYKVRFTYSTTETKKFMASEWVKVAAFASPHFNQLYKSSCC
jgi:hypothetical protein